MSSESTEQAFVDGLVQLSFLVQSILITSASTHDLTVPQVRLLGILRDREPSMLQLAGHLGLDKSSVTGLIDRAERRGLVQRASTTEDGRVVRVSSTPLGRRLTAHVGAEIETRLQALGQELSAAQRLTLTKLMSTIINNHHTTGPGSAPGSDVWPAGAG